jgi:hypothetical protein
MWGVYGDTSQDVIQKWFVVVAMICVPLMLLPKPLHEIYCSPHHGPKKEDDGLQFSGRLLDSSENFEGSSPTKVRAKEGGPEEKEHTSDEIFVHQLIETIEYVLGCISNTASYLRLWALSLAHSQLSEVFFEYLVEGGIVSGFAGIPAVPSPLPSNSSVSSSWRASPSAFFCAWTVCSVSCTRCDCTGCSSRTSSTRGTGSGSPSTPSRTAWASS